MATVKLLKNWGHLKVGETVSVLDKAILDKGVKTKLFEVTDEQKTNKKEVK